MTRTRRLMISWAVLGTLSLLWPSATLADGDWRRIGPAQASFSADHDTIRLEGPFDNFRKIKFKVKDAPLNIRRVVVSYDNGGRDELAVRDDIPQGGESRAIDLRGGERSLRKIEFWYDTKGSGKGKADIIVFGRK